MNDKRRRETNEERIEQLAPSVKPKVRAILEDLEGHGWQPLVSSGRRTPEQQAELVRAGNSKTLRSRHLTGHAADIVDVRYGWNPPKRYWLMLGSSARSHGMSWGGLWFDTKTVKAGVVKKALVLEAIAHKDWDGGVQIGWDPAHVEVPR